MQRFRLKTWQWVTLLTYLLILNVVIGTVIFLLIETDFSLQSDFAAPASGIALLDGQAAATKRPAFTLVSTPEAGSAMISASALTQTPGAKIAWTFLPAATPAPNDTAAARPEPVSTLPVNATAIDTLAVALQPSSTPTATDTPTLQPSPTPTATATQRPTNTSTPTAISTATPTSSPTPTASPSPTNTVVPTATATASATVSNTPSPTPSKTPTATQTQRATSTPTPIATATSTNIPTATPSLKAALVMEAGRAAEIIPINIQASPLTNHSLSLHWDRIDQNQTYHIYSDMGAGYDIYVYKGQTTKTDFVDDRLRPGLEYTYRVESLSGDQPQGLGLVSVGTYSRAPLASAGLASALTGETSRPRPGVAIIPAPTPLPPDALLLGLMSDASYTDAFDTLHVVGEVRNDSSLNVGEVVIVVSFYDASGNFISEARGETMLDHLTPGQQSPFLLTLPRPAGGSNYSIKAVGRPSPLELTSQIALIERRAYEDNVGFYHVEGTIENIGAVPVKQAKVIVTLYGRDGGVINVGFDYPVPAHLNPGERAVFEVTFTYFPRVLNNSVIIVNE